MGNYIAPEKPTDQTLQPSTNETMYCSNCGTKILKTSKFCFNCGAPVAQIPPQQSQPMQQPQQVQQPQVVQQPQPMQQPQIIINNNNSNVNTNRNVQKQYYVGGGKRPKSKWVALFLCVFFGYLGFHKFYEGRTGMGILYLLTFGLCGIGWFLDILALLFKPNPYYV